MDSEERSVRHTRLGLRFFAVYLLIYVGFMLASAFAPATMAADAPGGLNVALLYGLGLIVGAVVLALAYAWLSGASGARR